MATNQGDSTSSTPYTGEDAQDALKRIIGTKKEDTTSYSTDSGDSEDSVTQTPSDILDTSIGVREGILKSIDPNATNGFYYKVYFEGTNTSVDAKLTFGLGFSWTPEGEWENDIYYVSEEVKVKLLSIKDTLQWIIIGVEEETPTIVDGSSAITRGNSQIEVNTDYTTVTNNNSEVKVTDEKITITKDNTTIVTNGDETTITVGDLVFKVDSIWAYINDNKICIEPCGGEPATVLWYTPNRAVVFACNNYIYIYDLDNDELVGEIALDDITYIYKQNNGLTLGVIKSPDSYYTIDFTTGTISSYQKYRDKVLVYISEYTLVDEDGSIYWISEWEDLDSEPFFDASEYDFGNIVYIDSDTYSWVIAIYEKAILYINSYGIVEITAQINIDDIIGEEGTSEIITSAYTVYYSSALIITTTNKIVTLQQSGDTYIVLNRENIAGALVNKTTVNLAGYWGMTRFYLLENNKDIYYLDDPSTGAEILPRLEYITSFDEEVNDFLFINDYHLGSFQVSMFYGINDDTIYYIKSDSFDFTNAEKGNITQDCNVNAYGILWQKHNPI